MSLLRPRASLLVGMLMAAASLAAGPSSCTDVAARTTRPAAAWRHESSGESSRLRRAAAAIAHQLGNEEVKAQTQLRRGLRRREEEEDQKKKKKKKKKEDIDIVEHEPDRIGPTPRRTDHVVSRTRNNAGVALNLEREQLPRENRAIVGRRGRRGGGGRGRGRGRGARRSKGGIDGKTDDARGDVEAKRVGRGRKPKVLKWICQQAGCKNGAQYGQNRSATPLACKQHRESWHQRSKRYEKWTCKKSTCERHASYGRITAKGQRLYMFCGLHRTAGHVNLRAHECEAAGCSARGVFGDPATRVRQFCSLHRGIGHVNLNSVRCRHPEGCTSQASFGNESGRALTCVRHKQVQYSDVRSRSCSQDGCSVRASFGTKDMGLLFCWSHRRGMGNPSKCRHPEGCKGKIKVLDLCSRHFALSTLRPLLVCLLIHIHAIASLIA